MNKRPIGIVNIGEDGVQDILKEFPLEDIVALSLISINSEDKKEIESIVNSAITALIAKDIKIILCLDPLLTQFLPTYDSIPILGCVVSAVQQACSSSNNKIGVLSSPNALKTGCYGKAARNIRPTVSVTGGYIDCNFGNTIQGVEKAVSIFIKEGVDCVIIGESIPSSLIGEMAILMDPMVTFIEQDKAICQSARTILTQTNMLGDNINRKIEYIKE